MAEIAPRDTDSEIIFRANDEARLLLTEDKDFGELVFRWRKPVPGVLLLRIDGSTRSSGFDWKPPSRNVAMAVGHHTVVEAARFRSRALVSVVPR